MSDEKRNAVSERIIAELRTATGCWLRVMGMIETMLEALGVEEGDTECEQVCKHLLDHFEANFEGLLAHVQEIRRGIAIH
jgi:hypothetical protein